MVFCIYVINLEHSQLRWQKIVRNLDEFDLPYLRVEAVNGTNLSTQSLEHYAPGSECRKHYYRRLNSGEVGVALSHRKCWQLIVEQQLDFGIILEDDAILSDRFPDVVKSISLLRFGSWDFIKLFPSNKQGENNHANEHRFNGTRFVS